MRIILVAAGPSYSEVKKQQEQFEEDIDYSILRNGMKKRYRLRFLCYNH
jgi:hypothetical protein